MRPPSRPVISTLGVGTLYEPGEHALVFASSDRPGKLVFCVRSLRLPWLFVGEPYTYDAVYRACEALFFFEDPCPPPCAPFVRVSTVLGNSLGAGALCLGNVELVAADADLWNTAFYSVGLALQWNIRLARGAGDPCRALRAWDSEGNTLVHSRNAR